MDEALSAMLEALGLREEPFGIFYTDTEPAEGFAPAAGQPLSLESEHQGKIDFQAVSKNISCVLGKLWLARKRKSAAYFDAGRYGCPGGSFYLGFHKPQLDFITCYVSTGIPGTQVHGERYLSSPEVTRRAFTYMDPRPAPRRFCVFKPMSQFSADEQPELVTFFRPWRGAGGLMQPGNVRYRRLGRSWPLRLVRGAASWCRGRCFTLLKGRRGRCWDAATLRHASL